MLEELGQGHRGYVADLASLDEVRRLASEVRENEPRLDVRVTGTYFDGAREAAADPQASDARARGRLWERSEELVLDA